MKCHSLSFLIPLSLLVPASAHAREIEIDPGNLPRRHSIVTLPDKEGFTNLPVKSDDGKIRSFLQKSSDQQLVFIASEMAPGRKVTLKVDDLYGQVLQRATATTADDQVRFSVDKKPVATYQAAARKAPRPDLDPKFLRGGYLHPLTTPSGKVVTDDYALNHLHHHGVWTAWTKTSYDGREPDFWNMGQGKGKVDFVSLDNIWSGPVEAGLTSRHKFTDLTGASPVDVLNETWTVKAYAAGADFHLIDLESTQTVRGDKPLLLPVYHYGGIGIRGLEAWNGKDAATFITSENHTDRVKANSQPARWIAIGGNADGGVAGIAILSHPENFRAPQPVRIHPNEPFISFSPQTKEAMSIEPGNTYRSRYRFIIYDGPPDAKMIESLWQDYANPITARWID